MELPNTGTAATDVTAEITVTTVTAVTAEIAITAVTAEIAVTAETVLTVVDYHRATLTAATVLTVVTALTVGKGFKSHTSNSFDSCKICNSLDRCNSYISYNCDSSDN